MKTVVIDAKKIKDKETFHLEFKHVLGFPDFYGMNMDAWIDCMSDIQGGMTSRDLNTGEPLCIELLHTEDFGKRLPKLLNDLIDCTSFVNQRFIEGDNIHVNTGKYIVIKFL